MSKKEQIELSGDISERPNILLIGAGGHAGACLDVIEQQGLYTIAGLIGLQCEATTDRFGHAVIGVDEQLPELVNSVANALVAVGQIASPEKRIAMYRMATELGFCMPTIVSPRAYVSPHATVGAGTIVMHGAVINAGATVGQNCIVNSGALIEHDASVGNHCHVSTMACLNGGVVVGDGCFIGSGSVLRDHISIGKHSIIGMGLSVRKNQDDRTRFTG